MLRLLPALALLAQPVQAQVVGDPAVVKALMTDFGLVVEQDVDGAGDPRLSSRIEGTRFDVLFYDCDTGTCQSIQFTAAFDMTEPMDVAVINAWNRDMRFGKAYLDDEGDPFVEMDVNVDADGVGRKNFDDTLDIWRTVLGQFRNHIGW
ncbi:YbjN domain-containing protein [Paracoccus sp. p4-l81]|uniref:YbjN domain-containing protein n=1 Tax=unclassified Paracoccus (in: a-proteobacteria) TaxID=2688777 RepID=UPI0035BACFFC